jgi:hypothetical protein
LHTWVQMTTSPEYTRKKSRLLPSCRLYHDKEIANLAWLGCNELPLLTLETILVPIPCPAAIVATQFRNIKPVQGVTTSLKGRNDAG